MYQINNTTDYHTKIQTRFSETRFSILPLLVFTPLKSRSERRTPLKQKHYYQTISIYDTFTVTEIWHCTTETALHLGGDYIIPLDRKPRNKEIREG